jgi:hypothetical protein
VQGFSYAKSRSKARYSTKIETGQIAIENGRRAVVVDRATDGRLTTRPSFSDKEATRPAHQQTAINRAVAMPALDAEMFMGSAPVERLVRLLPAPVGPVPTIGIRPARGTSERRRSRFRKEARELGRCNVSIFRNSAGVLSTFKRGTTEQAYVIRASDSSFDQFYSEVDCAVRGIGSADAFPL